MCRVGFAWPSEAQRVKNGGPSGTVVSARAEVVSSGAGAVVLTTPATGFFILTQACLDRGDASGATELSCTSKGRIVRLETGDVSCTTFTPGIALDPGDSLVCRNAGFLGGPTRAACLVTGVVSSK